MLTVRTGACFTPSVLTATRIVPLLILVAALFAAAITLAAITLPAAIVLTASVRTTITAALFGTTATLSPAASAREHAGGQTEDEDKAENHEAFCIHAKLRRTLKH